MNNKKKSWGKEKKDSFQISTKDKTDKEKK